MDIIIFGSTGLVGNALLQLCISNPSITSISIVVRKKSAIEDPKLTQHIGNFDSLGMIKDAISGDVLFNCLGTTIKKAGSKKSQYEIDCLYPVKIAEIASKNGIQTMINVSSIGTSAKGNFYLKTKYDMEVGVRGFIGKQAYFLRPSFLVGNRSEKRFGEKIGIVIFKFVNLFLLGNLKKYKSIKAEDVAKAMLQLAIEKPQNQSVFEYSDIMELSKKIKIQA